MTPIEALERAITTGLMLDCYKRKQPGAIVERMPPDVRKQLEHLTSKDTLNMRVWK